MISGPESRQEEFTMRWLSAQITIAELFRATARRAPLLPKAAYFEAAEEASR